MTPALAATAAVVALTECGQCGARAGQACRGKWGRLFWGSTHSARRIRAKRYRKANPGHYRDVLNMALELSKTEYVASVSEPAAE